MVNCRIACILLAGFCEIFRVLGRFLHFKNTIKYRSKSRVNRKNTLAAAGLATFPVWYQCVGFGCRRLTLPQSASDKLAQDEKAPQKRGAASE
jgi:hypothetical protein